MEPKVPSGTHGAKRIAHGPSPDTAYRVVTGTYRLLGTDRRGRRIGARPDGDSLWFHPDRKKNLHHLPGGRASFNCAGCVQLRLEAIDALELHFDGGTQLRPDAITARDTLLNAVGFSHVTYSPAGQHPGQGLSVREAVPAIVRGHILTRSIDSPRNGRPVSFAFAGEPLERDGTTVQFDRARLRRSVNARLLESGLAYPMFYDSLPSDLRTCLRSLAVEARAQGRGLWKSDRSNHRNVLRGIADLERRAIWPKLYRRLERFFRTCGTDLRGFSAWLLADPLERDDALHILPAGRHARLHDVVATTRFTVRLAVEPEEMVVEG